MNRKKILTIFSRFAKANPDPTTELRYASPFELLIAVILSAQATDKSVNKATEVLFKVASTPEQILALGEGKLKAYIKSIGLYQTKSKNILATCQLLIQQHHSTVPANRLGLEALPGVGRKTANVILNTFFKEPVIAVDTHILRLANRIGLVHATTPLKVELALMEVIPQQFLLHAHHWLILHGRYICIARKPKCTECLIADLCEYEFKTTG